MVMMLLQIFLKEAIPYKNVHLEITKQLECIYRILNALTMLTILFKWPKKSTTRNSFHNKSQSPIEVTGQNNALFLALL